MKKILFLAVFIANYFQVYSQGTFPVYTDYLSDNVYLLHPSAAGIGNCGKLRLTYRQQWAGVENAPSLQTLSFHNRFTDKAAAGFILFNDENGYHAQKGAIGSFAYHLNFGHEDALDQLSLAISFSYVQNELDQSGFSSQVPDPVISQIIESDNYFNAEFSLGYHLLDMFSYFTVKNLLLTSRDFQDSQYESLNLRRYLLTFGYYFGRNRSVQWEPSIMGQYVESTGEVFMDLNVKAYKNFQNEMQLWAVLSYRQNFESNDYESLKQITPIVGVNYKRYMLGYTYTSQIGDITIDDGGFHQFTLGINLFCKTPRSTGCPNVNSIF